MNKDERLTMLITTEMKRRIKVEAEKQDINEPEYVRQAIDFYSSFDVHFLEHMHSVAEKMKQSMPIVIQNFLTAYIAAESAMLDTYGTSPKTYKRAFQYNSDGELIEGNELSEIVYQQTKVEAETLKKKLEDSTRTGKPAKISTDEGVFLATHLEPGSSTLKSEYKPAAVARAKSK